MATDGEFDLDSLNDLKVIELKELLRERGLATDGKKVVLVRRLKEFFRSEAEEEEEDSNKRKLEEEVGEEQLEPNKKQKFDHQRMFPSLSWCSILITRT